MVKIKTSLAGVTLIELMVVASVIGLLAAVGPKIIINITKFNRLSTARVETVRDTRDGLDRMNKLLRQAVSSSISISQETSQPPYSSISFTTVDNRSVKFYQQGNNLNFVIGGSTSTMTKLLRYVAFTYPRIDDTGIISVSITLEKQTYEGASKALHMAIEKVRVMN